MIKHLISFIFIITLSACHSFDSHPTNTTISLTVDADALSKGTLKISLPEKHPKYFAIKTPNNEWYYIQDSTIPIHTVPQNEFESASNLEFDVKHLEGVTWRNGIKVNERVFKDSGKYLIYFADNLETEPENTFSMGISVSFEKLKTN